MPNPTWRPPPDLALDVVAAAIALGKSANALVNEAVRRYLSDPKIIDPVALAEVRRVLEARPKEKEAQSP